MSEKIKSEVERLAQIIDAPFDLLPKFKSTTSLEEGAFLLRDEAGYHLAVCDRGQLRKTTYASEDDLLFAVFESITMSMALYSLPPEAESYDKRRAWFPRQIALLHQLSPEWATRETERHAEILREHPFDDAALARALLRLILRDQGYTKEHARDVACKQYPLPEKPKP